MIACHPDIPHLDKRGGVWRTNRYTQMITIIMLVDRIMKSVWTLLLLVVLLMLLLLGRHHPYWLGSAGFLLAAWMLLEPRCRAGLIILPIGGLAGAVTLLLQHP